MKIKRVICIAIMLLLFIQTTGYLLYSGQGGAGEHHHQSPEQRGTPSREDSPDSLNDDDANIQPINQIPSSSNKVSTPPSPQKKNTKTTKGKNIAPQDGDNVKSVETFKINNQHKNFFMRTRVSKQRKNFYKQNKLDQPQYKNLFMKTKSSEQDKNFLKESIIDDKYRIGTPEKEKHNDLDKPEENNHGRQEK